MTGSNKIEPFMCYYPNTKKLTDKQRLSYSVIKNKLDNDSYIDVEGNISYLFLYIYGILESIDKDENIIPAIKKLEKIRCLYSEYSKVAFYTEYWINGLYCSAGNYEKALPYYESHYSIFRSSGSPNNVLNIKNYLKLDINSVDLLALFPRKITPDIKNNVEKFTAICDSIIREKEKKIGMRYTEYIREKYGSDDEYECDLLIFMGLPCGEKLLKMNPHNRDAICYWSVPEVEKFAKEVFNEGKNRLRKEISTNHT